MALQQIWFEKKQGADKVALPVLGYADTLLIRPRLRLLHCIFPDSPSIRAIADNQDFQLVKERAVIRLLEAKLNGRGMGVLGLSGGTATFVIKPQTRGDRPIVFIPKARDSAEGVELINPDENFTGLRQVKILGRGVVEGSRDMADKLIKARLAIWYNNAIDRILPAVPLPNGAINLHALGVPDAAPENHELLSVMNCQVVEAEYSTNPGGIRLKLRYESISSERL